MKKLTTLILALVMTLSLAACGGTNSTVSTDNASVPETEDGNSTYTAESPLVFKIAYGDANDCVSAQACINFKNYVEEKSEGAIKCELYPSGQMGGDEDVVQAILLGNLHMTYCGTSVLCTFDDRFGIMDLPYLFTNWDTMDEAVNGGLGAMYQEWAKEYGLYVPGFMWDGCKTVSTSNKPVRTLEDMKGLKIRITNADLYVQTYKALGANPTPMGWNDIYTGLQQGTVDGMDVPAIPTYSNGFYDAIKYFSLTNNHMSNMCICLSDSFMSSLPGDIRTIIDDGIQEYLVKWDRENARTAEDESIQAMADAGVEIIEIEPDELEKFVAATEPVYDYYRELLGDEVMDAVEAFRG